MAASSFDTHDLHDNQAARGAGLGADSGSEIGALVAAAGRLNESLGLLEKQIVDYLLRRVTTAAVGSVDVTPLANRLDRLEAAVAAISPHAAATGAVATVHELRAMASQQQSALAAFADELRTQLRTGLQELSDLIHPAEPDQPPPQPADTGRWERAICGAGLASQPDLTVQRQQLLTGVLANQPAPCGLAGMLLIFQATTAERLPQMLKDVGEAYYRWQPKNKLGTDPFEVSLAKWLQEVCEKAGIPNTIELVHPGERFDASRHSTTSRGVEIAEVHGWIVLRDNGRVYAKANVTVR